ncbi:MAG: hypothetical protein ACW99A_02850 [Candidatus Kariarchaeaceae archaeon]
MGAWFIALILVTIIENVYFTQSFEGLLVLILSTWLMNHYAEKVSMYFQKYFIRHSLAVLDNTPELISFNWKQVSAPFGKKKDMWSSYNEIKGYYSGTIKLWIMVGKHKILYRGKGYEFNFDIIYLGRDYFEERFQEFSKLKTENLVRDVRKGMPLEKKYDLLLKHGLMDRDGRLLGREEN